jgi:hypothetical protein
MNQTYHIILHSDGPPPFYLPLEIQAGNESDASKLALKYASENSLKISHIEEINLAENQEKKYKSINKVYGKIYYNNK